MATKNLKHDKAAERFADALVKIVEVGLEDLMEDGALESGELKFDPKVIPPKQLFNHASVKDSLEAIVELVYDAYEELSSMNSSDDDEDEEPADVA